ncbi:hypothetical protein HMPREF9154_0336 [Arachnia propionica F0230a]|nr:hypothetical protein HMPREF9154_0336 [Arachnia propionica F0230a]
MSKPSGGWTADLTAAPRTRMGGFDTGCSLVAARLNRLRSRPPNASPIVVRQLSRRERLPSRRTPAL